MQNLRNEYKFLVGKPAWKRPIVKPRRRREDNIKIDLKEVECEDVSMIHLGQIRDQ
jgi:hypothetical protein